ncbi:MAG: N,N-dimethylformamidase beta subunit family domain-containing protein [Propionibacteriaceae bacterium]
MPTKSWRISRHDGAFGRPWKSRTVPAVEGFASRASVAPGQPVSLYVSARPGRWRVSAYRMGWYGGDKGARVWRSGWHKGRRQARPQTSGATRTPHAAWHPSLKVPTTGWRPGSYLFRLDASGGSSYVPLTVRSANTRGRLVLLTPDTTWQAYNDWGGRNLYWGPRGKSDSANRARAVSFDRPYAEGLGAAEFVTRMLSVVALAERLKLPLAYADDVDLHRNPHLLDGAAGLISMGHDEYYSVAMRRTLTAARNRGTNLAFLGANAVYRRIRLQSTAVGRNRLEVNYKDPAEDPVSRRHPHQTTANWPSPPAADPTGSLLGASYACFPGNGDLVVANASSWLLTGTKLRRGDRIAGALGPEFDAVQPRHQVPRPLEVVLHSPVRCRNFRYADATYYSTKSGAGVFNTGTMGWVKALAGRDGKRTQTLVENITTTLLRAFARPQAGTTHPARDTVGKPYPTLRR